MRNRWNSWIITLLLLAVVLLHVTCARKGLVADKYPEAYYRIPKLMPEGRYDNNPTFIVYGDNQAGWRAHEKFIKQKNWITWKMAIVPFYQLYLLGNGVIGGVNWVRQVPDYGERERRMMRDAIYQEAKRLSADFILNVGDMTADDGRRPSHWGLFLKEYREESPILDEVPYLPTAGNHDRVNDEKFGLPNYRAVFDYPGFYVMDFPDVSLFVTNSNFMLDQKQEIEDDRQDELFKKWFVSGDSSTKPSWLESELQARKDVFKVVSFHHPLLSVSHHASDWTNPSYGRKLEAKRRQLIELFKKENVHVVFSGHDHLYQHAVVRYKTQSSGEISNMHFVVSSGGGAPIRNRSGAEKETEYIERYRKQGIDYSLVKIAEAHHYCLVDVEPHSLTVQTHLVTENANDSNRLFDDFEINK